MKEIGEALAIYFFALLVVAAFTWLGQIYLTTIGYLSLIFGPFAMVGVFYNWRQEKKEERKDV